MHTKDHWETVYATKEETSVSWFQETPDTSLRYIESSGLKPPFSIVDIGGGASRLVDALVEKGCKDVSVMDLSSAALKHSQNRLGPEAASRITWLEGDVTTHSFASERYDVWHDRAVFHFLTDERDRKAYIANLHSALKIDGYVVLATFAEDGPLKCSGLPVQRYSATELSAEVGDAFTLVASEKLVHTTPAGGAQKFTYTLFRKVA